MEGELERDGEVGIGEMRGYGTVRERGMRRQRGLSDFLHLINPEFILHILTHTTCVRLL